MSGIVWKFGNDINTDVLAPGIYIKEPIQVLATHCLESIDVDFANKVKEGDYVLAGENFGIGSSREQAAQVLKELGVAAVIAKSFGGIFYRNAFNLGLPAVVIKKESNIDAGDCIKLELETGRINNQTKGVEIFTEIVPDNLLGLIKTGGLLGQLEKLKNIPIESINEK